MRQIKNKKTDAIAPKSIKEEKKRGNGGRAFLFVVTLAIFIAIIAFQVNSNARLNELVSQNTQLKKQNELLKSEEIQLNVELERKTNLREVERIATEEYGMVKMDKHQIEYIKLPVSDKAEILNKTEKKNGVLSDIIKNFNIILEYLS